MDTTDTSTTDTIDIESMHKKVKLNGDLTNAKTTEKNDSDEEFDFSSSDLEDLDSVKSDVDDEADNFSEPLSIMAVKSYDNDDNHLIEAKNDNINIENGDIQSIMDTVVNESDTSSLSKCSISLSNECNNQMDSISTNNLISDINTSTVDRHITNETITNSNNTADTSASTQFEEDDAYSDEDGAIVHFLGKANEIVGLVNFSQCVLFMWKNCGLICFVSFEYWVLGVFFFCSIFRFN